MAHSSSNNNASSGADDKATKLAWRKKPRRFAPKSRLGCKTCKYA